MILRRTWVVKLLLGLGIAGVLLLGLVSFTRRTPGIRGAVDDRVRKDLLRKLFGGPIQNWWGEMVRTAVPHPDGKIFYVGLGTHLGVLELKESTFKVLRKIPLLGFIHAFSLERDRLYVASGAAGLNVFDISDPRDPKLVKQDVPQGYALHIASGKGYGYLSNEEGGLVTYQKEKKEALKQLAQFHQGNVNFVLLDGDRAFLADGERGVVIMDISEPASPRLLSQVDMTYASQPKPIDVPPLALARQGNFLYAADGEKGLVILDVSDLSSPKVISQLKTEGFTYGVVVLEKRAYLADMLKGILVVDITDPRKPKKLKRVPIPGQGFEITWLGKNRFLVSAGAGGLQLWRIDDESAKLEAWYREKATAFDVAVKGELLALALGSGGVEFYNISEPSRPRKISQMATPGYARRVLLTNGLAFVADVIGGAHIVDLSQPDQPKILSSFDWQQHPWGIDVEKDKVFIADAHHGFTIFQWRTDGARFLSNYDLRQYSVSVAVKGNLALVGDLSSFRRNGLFVFDIANPENPRLLGALRGVALDISLQGTTAYIAAYREGLKVVDIADPEKPVVRHRLETGGFAYGVSLSEDGKRLFLADLKKGVAEIALKPGKPDLKRWYRTPGRPYAVASRGRILYVADGTSGLTVLKRQD